MLDNTLYPKVVEHELRKHKSKFSKLIIEGKDRRLKRLRLQDMTASGASTKKASLGESWYIKHPGTRFLRD